MDKIKKLQISIVVAMLCVIAGTVFFIVLWVLGAMHFQEFSLLWDSYMWHEWHELGRWGKFAVGYEIINRPYFLSLPSVLGVIVGFPVAVINLIRLPFAKKEAAKEAKRNNDAADKKMHLDKLKTLAHQGDAKARQEWNAEGLIKIKVRIEMLKEQLEGHYRGVRTVSSDVTRAELLRMIEKDKARLANLMGYREVIERNGDIFSESEL